MGIGINYYGYDGRERKMDFDGSPASQKELEEIARMGSEERGRPASGMRMPSRPHVPRIENPPETGRRESYKVQSTPYDAPGYLSDKIDPSGSLHMFLGRLSLKGDETAAGNGSAVYMRSGERRFWGGLNDLDPVTIGALIGPEVGIDAYEEDTSRWTIGGDKSAPTLNVCTRQICQPVHPDGSPTPLLNFFSFWRKLSFTARGRLAQVGAESRQLLATIVMGKGSGEYEVRPYYFKPSDASPNRTDCYLAYLAFGSGDTLAALPETLPADIRDIPEYQGCYIVPVEPMEMNEGGA